MRFDDTENDSLLDVSRGRTESGGQQDLRRRRYVMFMFIVVHVHELLRAPQLTDVRSSIALRFNALTQVGGVNSIENFARSWTRAAAFQEITPQRPSFIIQDHEHEEDDTINYGRTDAEQGRIPRTSLLREHLDASSSPENAIDEDSIFPEDDSITPMPFGHGESEHKQLGHDPPIMPGSIRGSIRPYLQTPFAGSYGTSYGTIRSNLSGSSMEHAGQLWRQQQASLREDGEHRVLKLKEVEQDGKVVLVVDGQSTLPQTIFNSTNVLIGVGLLSLPMGIKYAGWICGMIFLLLSALVTAYTAKLLAKCMDIDASLLTFGDIALIS